jgi:hypothetical protein
LRHHEPTTEQGTGADRAGAQQISTTKTIMDYDYALDQTNRVLIMTDRCNEGIPSLTNAKSGVQRMIEAERGVDLRK